MHVIDPAHALNIKLCPDTALLVHNELLPTELEHTEASHSSKKHASVCPFVQASQAVAATATRSG